jgi:hypothetical protein
MIKTPFTFKDLGEEARQRESVVVEKNKEISLVERVVAEVMPRVLDAIPAPLNGKDGTIGVDGKDGKNGLDGKNGTAGVRGEDGKDGINGESVTLDEVLEVLAPKIEEMKREIKRVTKSPKQVGGGGGSIASVTITSDTNIGIGTTINLVDATADDTIVTLPNVSQAARKEYHIKKTDSSDNTVTIATQGSETIDGETTQVISLQYTSRRIYSDGSNWHIV